MVGSGPEPLDCAWSRAVSRGLVSGRAGRLARAGACGPAQARPPRAGPRKAQLMVGPGEPTISQPGRLAPRLGGSSWARAYNELAHPMAEGGRAEIVRRLKGHGLAPEVCEGYFQVLRQFLTAASTKREFETNLRELLTDGQIVFHNQLIRDILRAAHAKRDGLPAVPVLVPVKDKKPVPQKRAPPLGAKRKKQNEDASDAALPKGKKLSAAGTAAANAAPAGAAQGAPQRARAPSRKGKAEGDAATGPPVGPSAAGRAPAGVLGRRDHQREVSTAYERMSFLPVRPGEAIDPDLFFQLRQRVRRLVDEETGLSGVKDDAVLLLGLALELHIKNLLDRTVATEEPLANASRPTALSPLNLYFSISPSVGQINFGDGMVVSAERVAMAICS
mmetsp:Transcript_30410/g.74118  ORF Transcript_30410/g.74118 Transcript_30410/m.74118 type:complete len:390 (-) Transcript_30410:409-1578(-)